MDNQQTEFAKEFNAHRVAIKGIAASVKATFAATRARSDVVGEDKGEVLANLMLTYRHLEDASQRLGKAIQAHDGGVSVYDRASTVGA